ncbi:MAG: sulfotransferase [Caulobacteraceae bacterium]|nr:sulfotransferase [Caulobacteraceae bacterium]
MAGNIYSTAATVGMRLQNGVALLQQGRLEEAWQALGEVVAADPDHALAHHLMGLVLLKAGEVNEGIGLIRRSIALDPRDAAAHGNLGNALRETGAHDEALEACEAALALDPGFLDAQVNRASALLELGRPAEALAGYDAALARQPNLAWVLNNRGNALRALNRNAEAADSFDKAMALEPGVAEIRVNAGFARLALGDYARGLELLEWRWKSQRMVAYLRSRAFSAPFWRGEEPLAGKTLLLHSEQGFGDILQFCRYAKPAADRGARVVVEVEAPLAALMATLPGVDQLVEHGQPLPAFDLHCPMMSLPFAFRTTVETIPAGVPYLFADPARTAAWAARLGPKTRPRVGLAWSSGVRPDQPELKAINGRRNIPLAKLAALKGVNADFFSLQKGQPAEGEFAALDQGAWDGPPIADTAKDIGDFADTAALIETLDLVVTVDTSTAHLAGALGKPVWIMNRFDACWRWLPQRLDSPWYPTARLFLQPAIGDWDSVLAEVRSALEARFGDRAGRC